MSSLKSKVFFQTITVYILSTTMSSHLQSAYGYLSHNKSNQQMQQTSINLNIKDLETDNILKIFKVDNLSNGQLKGEIKLNGETIKVINRNITKINLSSLLKRGTNIVEIRGSYTPINSSINIEFFGPNSFVSQEIRGTGRISQRLIIQIK